MTNRCNVTELSDTESDESLFDDNNFSTSKQQSPEQQSNYVENVPSNSKYFKSNPELAFKKIDDDMIHHRVKLHGKIESKRIHKKDDVLLNAGICGVLTVDKKKYRGIRTCAFDALVHVIQTVAVDDPNYYSTLEQAEANKFCSFIINLIKSGPVAKIIKSRFLLLKPFRKEEILHSVDELGEVIITYNFDSCPVFDWCKFLGHTSNVAIPSAQYTINCTICGYQYDDIIETLMVNFKQIQTHGYCSLESALHWNIGKLMPCQNKECKVPSVKVEIIPSIHIFVELGVTQGGPGTPLLSCHLKDISSVLEFDGVKYRFV